MRKEKGITLVALIITIIVLLILASVSISLLINEGIIGKSAEAVFRTEIEQYNEELKLAITEDSLNNLGFRDSKFNVRRSSYNDENSFTNAMKAKIPSFDKKYANKLEIKEDKLNYIGEDEQERTWLAQVISVAGMLKISYLYENGTEAAPTYQKVITDGSYEVESPTITGYEPDHLLVSGEINGDTNVTVTYYGESQGLEYEELSDGTLTVKGIGTFTGEGLVIPAKHNGKDVTQIKDFAFASCQIIKTAVISKTITNIGNNIFSNCRNLEYLNYDSVTIPSNKYFPKFIGLNIKELYIGPNVSAIGVQTFKSCKNLKKVIIYSNSVERLWAAGFEGCTSLQQIEVNKDNTGYMVENNILYSKDGKTLFLYPPGKTEEDFKILDSVEIIDEDSCAYNQYLKNVEIPSTIKTVKGSAFYNCNNLEYLSLNCEKTEGNYAFQSSSLNKVNIGINVKSISVATFGNCTNLTDVTVYSEQVDILGSQFNSCSALKEFKLKENHSKYNEKDGVLYSKDWKKLYACPPGYEGELEIKEGTETTINYSFRSNYPNITKLILPVSIRNIEISYFKPHENIYYKGTTEQWSSVTINKTGSTLTSVICSDGTINL